MFSSFFYGVLTVLVVSILISLFFERGRMSFFELVLGLPGMASTLGCWIFPIISFFIYLFVDSPNHLAYWLTINVLLSSCCLSNAMSIEINPAKVDSKEIYISFIIGLIVTAFFVLLPYNVIRILLAFCVFVTLVYNLYIQNCNEFKEIFNLHNYRFLEDCIFMYFFPAPLLIFFIITCFI